MKRYSYLVVEGQHDVAFVARLLKALGINQVTIKNKLDAFWYNLIPNSYPPDGDLVKRVSVPSFFENDADSVAIQAAEGIEKIVKTLNRTRERLDSAQIVSYGLVLDADKAEPPQQRFDKLLIELHQQAIDLPQPAFPGEIAGERPAFGIYILPDNKTPGTLEDILLQCAQVNYTNLSLAAQAYLHNVDRGQLTAADLAELNKPAGQKKAQVGSVASLLRPGKSIQVSIQDNRWLTDDALNLPDVKTFRDFLARLLGLV